MTQIRAFVSYARADTDTVKALVGRLEAHDVAIWLDARSIPVSSDWLQEILRGIESCDVFVFIFSMRSAVSEVCKLELSHAATHCKRIVPVLIEPVGGMEAPQELASRQWLDVTRAGLGDGVLRQLVQAISTDLPWIRQHTRLVERGGPVGAHAPGPVRFAQRPAARRSGGVAAHGAPRSRTPTNRTAAGVHPRESPPAEH